MRKFLISMAALSAAIVPAAAADLYLPAPEEVMGYDLPAVSGINGKAEVLGGFRNLDGDDSFVGAIGGTVSIPVGHSFGVQLDAAASMSDDDTAVGGAIHAFMRDPSSYLIGITAGVVRTDNGNTLSAVGAEGELYLDRISLEAWAGYARLDYNDDFAIDDLDGGFFIGDVAWYANDNWRLAIGGSYILEEASLNLSTEYQFDTLPFSVTGQVSFAEDDNITATIGLRGYFGAPSDRTLIERHRQDDPQNRALGLIGSTAGQIFEGAPPEVIEPPAEEPCLPPYFEVNGECIDSRG
ncbi:TonB-dependent receptor [Devosia aurantiaca]|uniref:Porin family protein n=1 Tax=Devosia aurantiaca TaxID=2714858 RepID=A0A6M1SUA7_9HYPH|nr:hypothetical protein [Devosia aurantiaca]NGP18932.1 hypothetical protein [Devosia aurantiaca]